MKPARLSLRLGLSVSLMGAALVLLLASLAVLALDHELDNRARKVLARKMEQIEHSLGVDLKASDLGSRAHPLLDLVMGHDDLSLNIIAQTGRHPALLSLGLQWRPSRCGVSRPGRRWATANGRTAPRPA